MPPKEKGGRTKKTRTCSKMENKRKGEKGLKGKHGEKRLLRKEQTVGSYR
jgi:hypothetical protein